MAPPKEIATVIYHNGHIVDDLVQRSVCTCVNPIFIYVSCSITLTKSIRKINNRLLTKKVAQLLLFHFIRVRHVIFQHNYSTMTISEVWWKQFSRIHNWIQPNAMLLWTLFLNHDLRLHNRHVHNYNYCLHNKLPYLNDPVSSYNNLETQDAFDIYTSYTQLLSENDSFFMPNKPPLTNKTIFHPNLRHPHNNHKLHCCILCQGNQHFALV